MLNFFSIARPSWPSFQIETKQNFTFGFSLIIVVHPPLLSSAWQFEHHGAQRWTTVRSGDLMASSTLCSVGDSARSEAAATNRINQRRIDIDFKIRGKRPTLNAERPTLNKAQRLPLAGILPPMQSPFTLLIWRNLRCTIV